MMKYLIAAFGGCLVPGLIHAGMGWGWDAIEPMLRDRIFAVFIGNLFLSSLFGLWCMLRKHSVSTSFFAGAAVGISGACFTPWLGVPVLLCFLMLAIKVGKETILSDWHYWVLGTSALATPILSVLSPVPYTPLPTFPGPALPSYSGNLPSPEGPDIVLVVADTLRADAILSREVNTPSLDQLRTNGMWANHAVAPCNQTIPSHLSLLTGLTPEKIGMRSNLSGWPSKELLEKEWGMVSLASRFQNAGWRTAAVVANSLLSKPAEGGLRPDDGFEVWDGIKREDSWMPFLGWKEARTWFGWLTPPGVVTQTANLLCHFFLLPSQLRFGRAHLNDGPETTMRLLALHQQLVKEDRPFFLFANFMDVHAPYLPPGEMNPVREFDLRDSLRKIGESGEENLEISAELQRLYLLELEELDRHIGRIVSELESTGRPFILFLTGDHGELFGQHGFVEHSSSLLEGELQVPFIFYGQNIPKGESLHGDISLIDGTRTLCELAGLDTSSLDGRNVRDAQVGVRPPLLSFMQGACSMKQGTWKAVFKLNQEIVPSEIISVTLFDLKSDPSEAHNVANENPEVVESLTAALKERLKKDIFPELGVRELTWREQRMLEGMGYKEEEEE